MAVTLEAHAFSPRASQPQTMPAKVTPLPVMEDPPVRTEDERPAGVIGRWLRDIFFSILVAMLIVTFLYQPVRVDGTSMAPGLLDRERVFINKLGYRLGEIHRQDIAIFKYPNDPSKTYIKRVIALPGDMLRIDRGHVYVNGEMLQEPYVAAENRDQRSFPETQIPAGEYFVMGDHRNISSDSREFGPVARGFIYGKAMFIYWPLDDAGWVQ